MYVSDHKLGCASMLVQAKLGHDLRPYLADTLAGGLPPRLQALVDQMMGYTEYRNLDDGGDGPAVSTGAVEGWESVAPKDAAVSGWLDGARSDTLDFRDLTPGV